MVTLVGTQNDFMVALKELIELEYEAVEVHEAALNRMKNEAHKGELRMAQHRHQKRIKELSNFLSAQGQIPPVGPSGTQLISVGKVALADMIGDDNTILKALRQAQNDITTAYERMNKHPGLKQTFIDNTINTTVFNHDRMSNQEHISPVESAVIEIQQRGGNTSAPVTQSPIPSSINTNEVNSTNTENNKASNINSILHSALEEAHQYKVWLDTNIL